MNNPDLHVLIVGIDSWINPKLPPLKGCVNDAKLMQSVFRDRFGVAEENIAMLTNEDATRDGITTAFRSHLIDRARQLAGQQQSGVQPSFVFCFAGHGSRTKDRSGTQPDGMDETIVPYDSRTGEVYDIKDWELASWLDELTSYTSNVTVILDCCHSGSGTRNTESTGTARMCEPDWRQQPTVRPSDIATTGTRSAAEDSSGSTANYTLLAACRSYEFAQEYVVKDGDDQYKHGAFTYFLAQELMQLPPDSTVTYRDIHERVRHAVHSRYRSQMPQCEGDADRILFGGARAIRDPMMTIDKVQKKNAWVNAGLAHGLSNGARLNVYPPDTRQLNDKTIPVATLVVQDARAVRSRCRIEDDANIQQFCRATLLESGDALPVRVAAIDIADIGLADRVEEALRATAPSSRLEVIRSEVDEKNAADFRISLNSAGRLELRDAGGELLVTPSAADDVWLLAQNVSSICHWENILQLKNRSSTSGLNGKVSVAIHSVIPGQVTTQADTGREWRDVRPIESTSDGTPVITVGDTFAIEIKNDSEIPLFCEAISLGFDYAVVPLTEPIAKGTRKRVAPGGTIWFGRDSVDEPVEYNLPDDPELASQFTEAREFLKVIATEEEADFSVVQQRGIDVAVGTHRSSSSSQNSLDQLLESALAGSRALGSSKKKAREKDWTTTEMEYVVVKSTEASTHPLMGGQRLNLPEYDLAIEPPAEFSGQVRVVTEPEAVRAASRNSNGGHRSAHRPSGPTWESDNLTPLSLGARRCSATAGAALEIEADSDALATVSDDNPLKLHLPHDDDNGPVLAVAWDGEVAVPVGGAESGTVDVTWIPNPPASDQSQDIAAGSRGFLRQVKFYLYKLRHKSAPDEGLRSLRFLPDDAAEEFKKKQRRVAVPGGYYCYEPVDPEAIKAGQRVAVLLNGFTSESENMVRQVLPMLRSQDIAYDHILTFDYEGVNTPVPRNGKILHQQLTLAGLKQNDDVEVDVIGHGAGGIVARAMIELHQGHQLVDRCVLIGAPNQGSSMLKLKEAIPWLATAIMFVGGPFPVRIVMSNIVRRVGQSAKGVNDLAKHSQFIDRLNENGQLGNVQYHIVAGQCDTAGDRVGFEKLWHRLNSPAAPVLLRSVFGEDHDMVVNTPGMLVLSPEAGKKQPKSTTVVRCHHFDYFAEPEPLNKLASILRPEEQSNTDEPNGTSAAGDENAEPKTPSHASEELPNGQEQVLPVGGHSEDGSEAKTDALAERIADQLADQLADRIANRVTEKLIERLAERIEQKLSASEGAD